MNTFLQTIGALNDETRLTILRFIDENGAVCVCDIEASFGMIQSRISRHLKILKEAVAQNKTDNDKFLEDLYVVHRGAPKEGDLMRLLVEDEQVQREHREHEGVEANPKPRGANRRCQPVLRLQS